MFICPHRCTTNVIKGCDMRGCQRGKRERERERESVDCVDNNLLEAKKMKKIPAFVLRTRNNRRNMILMMTTVDVVVCLCR